MYFGCLINVINKNIVIFDYIHLGGSGGSSEVERKHASSFPCACVEVCILIFFLI